MQSMGEKNRARLGKCVGCSKVGLLRRSQKGMEGLWGEVCGVKVVAKMGDREGLLEGIVPGAKIPPDTSRHPVAQGETE